MALPAVPLAAAQDVAILWPSFDPSDPAQLAQVEALIVKASARLRQRIPWLDSRIAKFVADPTDLGGVDPATAADVVATIVKRYLSNPSGATNETKHIGAYSYSQGYALRGDKDIRGELVVTDNDVLALTPATRNAARAGTVRTRARMAPFPFGDAGGSVLSGGSVDSWLVAEGLNDPSWEFGPLIGYNGAE